MQPVGRWNICETRNGSNQTTFQQLWGTRYTDELIWLEKNGDPTESNDTNPDDQSSESTADSRYFVHQDRNWNVVALSEYDPNDTNNGRIIERYSYTPYGSFVVLKGDSGSGELNLVSLNSSVGNLFAHQGLPMDNAKSSYQNRHREYVALFQRFAQPDPAQYRSGLNLYEYLESTPDFGIDPTGLAGDCDDDCYDHKEDFDDCIDWATNDWDILCCDRYLRRYQDCIDAAVNGGNGCMVAPPAPAAGNCNYPRNHTYSGVNANCMCRCMGNDPWSQAVRSCLRCYYDNGCDDRQSHSLCYEAGDRTASRPFWKLIWCAAKCVQLWANSQSPDAGSPAGQPMVP